MVTPPWYYYFPMVSFGMFSTDAEKQSLDVTRKLHRIVSWAIPAAVAGTLARPVAKEG